MRKGNIPNNYSYLIDQEKIMMSLQGEQFVKVIPWKDLKSVIVVTTPTGPFKEDCFIEIVSKEGKVIVIPNNELERAFFYDRLSSLPGFDHYRCMLAMGITVDDRFEVWRRLGQTDAEILDAVSDQNILPRQPGGLGLENARSFFLDLIEYYTKPERYYHNWMHIKECLKEFWTITSWHYPREIWCAIIFHDVIYVADRKDNEVRSADYAVERLEGLNVDRDKVKEMILLTAQHQRADQLSSLDDDAKRFLDIDRSILGSIPVRYQLYAMGVRLEYTSKFGRWKYLLGRARFLRALLRQPRIFLTEEFEARLGQTARENLKAEWRSIPYPVRLVTSCLG